MGTVAPPAYTPTPDDVAALLHARTKDPAGNELGEWTEETRPTLVQVEALCGMVAGLYPECLGAISDQSHPAAKHALTLRAACLVELGYFPEQVADERSPFNQMLALFEQIMFDLCPQDVVSGGGGAGGAGTAPTPLPVWMFPPPGPVGVRHPCWWDATIQAHRIYGPSGALVWEGVQLWLRPVEDHWLTGCGCVVVAMPPEGTTT